MYYKVLFVGKDSLESAATNRHLVGLHREHALKYPLNKWVSPIIKNSKLFVFDNLDNARRFIGRNFDLVYEKHEIWEVKVQNPVQMAEIAALEFPKVLTFWSRRREAIAKKIPVLSIYDPWIDGSYVANAPLGTFGVSKLKLVKKIE